MTRLSYELERIRNAEISLLELLSVLQDCYRKHCMADDYSQDIGWDELSNHIHDALVNVMGHEGFEEWKDSLKGTP